VKDWLVTKKGIAEAIITTRGLGETKPVARMRTLTVATTRKADSRTGASRSRLKKPERD